MNTAKNKILFRIPLTKCFLVWYPEYKLFGIAVKEFKPSIYPYYVWRFII